VVELANIEKTTHGSTEERAQSFLIEEFKALRNEIDASVQETRSLERLAVISTGGVWTWLLKESKLGSLAAWLPLPIVFLCGIRSLAIYIDLLQMNKYIQERTEKFLLGTQGGWRNSPFQKERAHVLLGSAVVFWVLLLALTYIVPRFREVLGL
jgi:hypothetical protein